MAQNTTGLIQSLMNQPMYQQAILNARTVGRDKRAVGAGREVLGKAVAGERQRLAEMDKVGEELATRRQKLGFAKAMAAKQEALAREKLETQKEESKLAYNLGLASTAATGFGAYTSWRDRKETDRMSQVEQDYYRLNTPGNIVDTQKYAEAFNRAYSNYR